MTPERELPLAAAEERPAECRITGQAVLDASSQWFAGRDEQKSLAHFNGRRVDLEVREVPGLLVDRVGLHAATHSGFALDGWIDRTKLKFSARQRIPLSGDVAWIPRGTALTIKVGDGKKLVVSPATRHLASLDAMVPCEQLALGAIELERPLEEVGDLYALAGDRLAVSPTRGGPPVFTLRPRPGASLVLSVEDRGDGMHLRFHDGIAVEGWVDRAALTPLTSFGAIGCGGCGIGYGRGIIVSPGSKLATVRRTATIGIGEKGPGIPHGKAAAGAEVIVLEELSGSARVIPRCMEILPEAGQAFWISRADLDVGIATSNIKALDAGCH